MFNIYVELPEGMSKVNAVSLSHDWSSLFFKIWRLQPTKHKDVTMENADVIKKKGVEYGAIATI
jgi:hypothetical protein